MNVLIIGAGEINFGKYESIAIVHLRCDGDWTNDQGRSKALGTTYVLSPYPRDEWMQDTDRSEPPCSHTMHPQTRRLER